jgi:hypothetical protein
LVFIHSLVLEWMLSGWVVATCHVPWNFMLFVLYIFLDYVKLWSDKCTLFINCYLIQSILKIVQYVSNYVTVHL